MSSAKKQWLGRALGISLEYILGRQQSDGSWVDWNLPPGQSRIWTTAYVGYRLKNIPAYLRTRTQAPMRAASNWLLRNMFSDSGWGYSEETGSDADSTALAILFLSTEGETVPDTCYSFLRTFQRLDGGFCTYHPSGAVDSWGVSHGDVTPTAILALLTRYGMNAEIVERGIDYLVKTQTSSGVWESFWWTSFLYSTEASLAVRNDADFKINSPRTRKTLLSAAYKGAFEAALLLSSLMHLNPKLLEAEALRLIEELLHNQEPDGSWRNNPILRVTRRECFDPWRSGDSDTLFADTNRLFTTSTVVEALSRVYERA